ncbi:MAG TPA: M1 family aminopeptidase [Thermoanaerobaculia bacterium]|nr:M1 family aminopeptidase [Thermoanaerobaculia bacterium]
MRNALAVLLFCAVLFSAANVAAQNPSVDVQHYAVDITLPSSGAEISAVAELTVTPRVTPLEWLVLDFGALDVDSVSLEGKDASWWRTDGDRMTIAAMRTTADPFRVRIAYHGKPADGLVMQPNKYGHFGVFADNWPNRAHQWFPSVDHPSDKATVEFRVTAPAAFDVIANGTLTETASLQDGSKRWHWRETTPIPVHCMVIGATEFAIVRAGEDENVEVLYYLYPRDRDDGVRQFGRAVQMVDFYADLVGPYPYDKLAIVESSTRFGGMENASAIFLDEKRIHGPELLEPLVAHEIAHQWFGDSVSQRDWHDVWLSEGFATYFGVLFFERADGREPFREAMRKNRNDYLKKPELAKRPIYDPSIAKPGDLLSAVTYDKAGWVLHMLRGVIGDQAFFAGVRDYYAAYRDGNAGTADLRVIMERHAGQPLDWFFRQWIYEPGHPVFTTKWTWRRGKLTVDVAQTQPGTVFRTPAVLEVRNPKGAHRENVLIDERSERFEIEAQERPTDVVLDPDEWILHQ